ncbi:MAG: SpoIIE family protein phosphatase [Treponema sp.]|nr:SpoIIE family protein phosphatase [Treponema sp.]MCL2250942.1 SpoIIE family protein phosphatase [Treponema sp.]
MFSIRTKIILIGLIFIALIGIAFFIYSIRTTVNYKSLRLEGIEKTVAFETEKVNKIIAEIEQGTLFYAISGMLAYKSQSIALSEDLIIESVKTIPILSGGGFWFEPYAYKNDILRAGFFAFRDKSTGIVKTDDRFLMEEYDYHTKGWYKEIIENIDSLYNVVWTRPYLDDLGALMTTAGSGIFNPEGKLIAITTADWEIEDVIKELVTLKPTANSFVLLCVPEKDYIISSTRTSETIGLPMSYLPWDITADAFNFNGIDYMRFGKYMDNGWLLSIQIPEKEIFADAEKQNERFSIMVVIVSVVMILTAYFLISRLINAPIKQLTQDVSHIALGNLDAQIKVSSKDEIGLLAQVFNKMTSDLKTAIEEKTNEHAEKERISAELNVAASIQASMLPCVFPPFPDRKEFELYASMIPAKEVCGDFYDFFFIDNDNLVILIADVSGKGVPAALFMVIAKTLIKNCSSCRNPAAVFDSVNKKLCEGNDAGMFVTSFIGFYNLPAGRLKFVNAGHNPPLLKKKDKPFEYLKTQPCVVLGFMEQTEYNEEEINLDEGDMIFLYTDGVTEAMNKSLELFGEARLLNTVNKKTNISVQELIAAIKTDVDNFAQEAEQADDITMLAFAITDKKNQGEKTTDTDIYIKKLITTAVSSNLEKVINFIDDELSKNNYPAEEKNEICIAVEEIFMNIVNYAFVSQTQDPPREYEIPNNQNREVTIKISTNSKTIIQFEDKGRPYNPLEQPDPDLEKSIKEREIGGLGIFMVKNIMDRMEYSRVNGGNVLMLTKNKSTPKNH